MNMGCWGRIVALGLFVATLLYMGLAYNTFPERVPMQWDASNQPNWHASRPTFFLSFGAFLVFLTVIFTFLVPLKHASMAWIGALVSANFLLMFHMIFQQVNPEPFLYISPSFATLLVLVVTLPAFFLIAFRVKRDLNKTA